MFEFAVQWIKDNIKREEGQAMAEYGIILALVAAVVIATLVIFGNQILNTLKYVTSQL
jgi:Flp pilus assembly pilin Flp